MLKTYPMKMETNPLPEIKLKEKKESIAYENKAWNFHKEGTDL